MQLQADKGFSVNEERITNLENAYIELSQHFIEFQRFVLDIMQQDIEYDAKKQEHNEKIRAIQEETIEIIKEAFK